MADQGPQDPSYGSGVPRVARDDRDALVEPEGDADLEREVAPERAPSRSTPARSGPYTVTPLTNPGCCYDG